MLLQQFLSEEGVLFYNTRHLGYNEVRIQQSYYVLTTLHDGNLDDESDV